MPTKDLEDRYRPQRLGKVRLGIKKKNKQGVEYPSATDYFVLPEIPGLKEIYGEKPTTLDIVFLFDSIDATFPHFHKWYSKRGLRCLGDGEIVYYRTDGTAENPAVSIRGAALQEGGAKHQMEWGEIYGEVTPIGNSVACRGINCPVSDGERCRPTGRLCFSVIGLPMLGYLELTVHQRALLGIAGQLKLAHHIFGHLTGIPFKLHLSQETIQVKGKSLKIWTPWLEIDHGWLASNLPKPEERKALVEAKAAADREELYGPNDVEELDYTPMPPEEIEEAQAEENDNETKEDPLLEAALEMGGEIREPPEEVTVALIQQEANAQLEAMGYEPYYKNRSHTIKAMEACGYKGTVQKYLTDNFSDIVACLIDRVKEKEQAE